MMRLPGVLSLISALTACLRVSASDEPASAAASGALSNAATVKEYCNMETFNASCSRPEEVILIQRARYGRMKLGRCVKRNLGYIGCAVDVMGYLDARCSGRKHCEFHIPDPVLYKTQPCPDDTTPYLEVAYECLTVVKDDAVNCASGQPIRLHHPVGYISSSADQSPSSQFVSGRGSDTCRWLIEVQHGQRVNLTQFNFNRGVVPAAGQSPASSGTSGTDTDDSMVPRANICYEYATVNESIGAAKTNTVKQVTMCGGERREKPMYESKTNRVEVQLVNKSIQQILGPFLIRYEAIGCPDITPPKDGTVRREGDVATVTCSHSNEVWYMTCRGISWAGKFGNCSYAASVAASAKGQLSTRDNFPYGILIVVAVGVALGVLLGGLLLIFAVFYMRRRRSARHCDSSPQSIHEPCLASVHANGKFLGGCYFESTAIHSHDSPQFWDRTLKFVPHDLDDPTLSCREPRRCVLSCTDGSFVPTNPDLGGSTDTPGMGPTAKSLGDVTFPVHGLRTDCGRHLAGNVRHQHTYEFPTCL